MRTLLLTLLTFVGIVFVAPQAEARHYSRSSDYCAPARGYSYGYGRPSYYGSSRVYYSRPSYRSSYYSGYHSRSRYYSDRCYTPRYYSRPRLSFSIGF